MSTFVSTAEPITGRSRMTRFFALLVGFAVLCFGLAATGLPAANAIGNTGTGMLKGTISLPAGTNLTTHKLWVEEVDGRSGRGEYLINADGGFMIDGFETGTYRLSIVEAGTESAPWGTYDLSKQVLKTTAGDYQFSINDGQTLNLSFVMQKATATIQGTADLKGYDRLLVDVMQLIDGEWRNLTIASDKSGASPTTYTSAKLAPGEYTLNYYVVSDKTDLGGFDCVKWLGNVGCWDETTTRTITIDASGSSVTDANVTFPYIWEDRPAPTASGTPEVGKVFTGNAGQTVPVSDSVTYQWYRTSTETQDSGAEIIPDATSPSYTPTAADVGYSLQFNAVYNKAKYNALDAWSTTSAAVINGTLIAGEPTITGTAKVGSQLTANAGTWTPAAELSYQWLRGGEAISGAAAEKYELTAADAGQQISVRVTGKKDGYQEKTVTSSAKTVAAGEFTSAPAPTISGTAKVGSTLTAKQGAWKPTASKYVYQWLRDGNIIAGATESTYVPSATDAGKQFSVRVTGKKDGYQDKTVTSAAMTVARGEFTSAPAPTISGTAKVGSTLTAESSEWMPAAEFSYEWLRGGEVISGATVKTYKLTVADAGKQVSVRVTGTKDGYQEKAVTSEAKTVAAGKFTSAPMPTISGTAKVGSTLTAKPGAWKPAASKYVYQWLRDGNIIAGATESTYMPSTTDAGKQFSVRVTGKKDGYQDKTVTSAKTAKVVKDAYVAPATTPFNDVATNYKFYEPIAWMFTEGLSTGVKTNSGRDYQPKVGVSREAMAAFLYRLEGANYKGPKVSPFADVKPGDKFYNEIAWMYQTGLSTGVKQQTGKPNYAPKAKVSREAMAAFIYRLEHATAKAPNVSPFGDMNTSDKFFKEIAWMSSEGLSTGIRQASGKPFYAPKAQVSREAMAAFLYRLETR